MTRLVALLALAAALFVSASLASGSSPTEPTTTLGPLTESPPATYDDPACPVLTDTCVPALLQELFPPEEIWLQGYDGEIWRIRVVPEGGDS